MNRLLIIILSTMAIGAMATTIEDLRVPDVTGLTVNEQEMAALNFLYAYMPLADLTDYSTAFHLENLRATIEARETMPWGHDVPELLFNHFVLPLRVNNEALDMSRPVFFNSVYGFDSNRRTREKYLS